VGGKLIHEKTRSKKSRDTVPLSSFLFLYVKYLFFGLNVLSITGRTAV
jgi:hypothetical protein